MAEITFGCTVTTGLTEFTSGTGGAGRCHIGDDSYGGEDLYYTASEGDVLTKLSAYTGDYDDESDGPGQYYMALYEIVGGVPVTRAHAYVTLSVPSETPGWVDSAPLSYALTAGAKYSIGVAAWYGTKFYVLAGVSTDNITHDDAGFEDPWVPSGFFSSYIPIATATVETDGGSIEHDLTAADSNQGTTSTSDAIVQTRVLTAATSTQGCTSSTGSIEQTGTLTAANSTQVITSSTAAIVQTRLLTGSNVNQVNTCSSNSIGNPHTLTGSSVVTINSSTTGAIAQTGIFSGGNCVSSNLCNTGAISQAQNLTAAPSVATNVSSAAAVIQTRILTALAAVVTMVSSTGAFISSQGYTTPSGRLIKVKASTRVSV